MPTIIKNGRNYSGTSVSLTQAEYDALPEVTKMNGTTYFITDSDVVLNAEDVALDGGNLNDLAGSVATIETSPATTNHEVGDYILWNGQLYKVTTAIATGENLVINSNISTTTVGTELQTLNNGLIVQFLSTGWTTTETVNNTTYYTQTVSVTSVSSDHPEVGIVPISGTLPTNAEQDAFDSVEYFTANDTTNTIKAYATSAPGDTFAVVVKGAS